MPMIIPIYSIISHKLLFYWQIFHARELGLHEKMIFDERASKKATV